MSAQEPMAHKVHLQTKNKATTGTTGYSQGSEYEVSLEVSLVVKKNCISRYKVVMTARITTKPSATKNVQNLPQNPAPISRSAFMQTVTTVLLLPVLLPWPQTSSVISI